MQSTWVKRSTVSLTSDGSGAGTAYTDPIIGRLISITYTPDATAPYDTGVDFTITLEESGVGLWTQLNIGTSAVTVSPRQPTHDQVGGAALYAAAGTAVRDYVFIGLERIKIVIASAGAAKVGRFDIVTS